MGKGKGKTFKPIIQCPNCPGSWVFADKIAQGWTHCRSCGRKFTPVPGFAPSSGGPVARPSGGQSISGKPRAGRGAGGASSPAAAARQQQQQQQPPAPPSEVAKWTGVVATLEKQGIGEHQLLIDAKAKRDAELAPSKRLRAQGELLGQKSKKMESATPQSCTYA